MTVSWPNRLLPIDEWDALPANEIRRELFEGSASWPRRPCHGITVP